MAPSSPNLTEELSTLRGQRPPKVALHLTCRGCAAVFLIPADGTSLHCPYCQTVNVIDAENTVRRMAPDRILLATIDDAQAADALRRWSEKHRVDASPARLEGVYLPFWTFEITGEIIAPQVRKDPRQPGSDISADILRVSYALKPRPAVAEYLRDLGRLQPLIDRLPLSRSVCLPATHRLPGLLTKVARASATPSAVAFEPVRLNGWPAETYQVSAGEAAAGGRGEAVKWAQRDFGTWFRGRGSYDTSGLMIQDFDLLLIPLWVGEVPRGPNRHAACVHAVTGEVLTD